MDGDQTPLGAIIAPANEHEVRHIERLVKSTVVDLPEYSLLIYDKAADSDALRDRLAERGIELICPHCSNRKNPKTQDGRKLRRAKNTRWRIQRTNSWSITTVASPCGKIDWESCFSAGLNSPACSLY